MHRSFSFFPILCSLTLFFDDLLFIPGEQFASRVQMTEDELVVNFFQFDGNFCCHCLVFVRVCRKRYKWRESGIQVQEPINRNYIKIYRENYN